MGTRHTRGQLQDYEYPKEAIKAAMKKLPQASMPA
jgi:hypothetical protein